jgi:hypothetical protein
MKTISNGLVLALGLLISATAIAADDFGRLFTTPTERASLDHLRKTTPLPSITQNQPKETAEQAVPVMPSAVSVEGYVKRGDGKKGTVWVNGAPVQENSSTSEVQVGKMQRGSNQIPIKLQAGGKSLNLKAGQTYDPETNSVSEIDAHARKMAKKEGEDSGTIGENIK